MSMFLHSSEIQADVDQILDGQQKVPAAATVAPMQKSLNVHAFWNGL